VSSRRELNDTILLCPQKLLSWWKHNSRSAVASLQHACHGCMISSRRLAFFLPLPHNKHASSAAPPFPLPSSPYPSTVRGQSVRCREKTSSSGSSFGVFGRSSAAATRRDTSACCGRRMRGGGEEEEEEEAQQRRWRRWRRQRLSQALLVFCFQKNIKRGALRSLNGQLPPRWLQGAAARRSCL
jgi:hypothetical protein